MRTTLLRPLLAVLALPPALLTAPPPASADSGPWRWPLRGEPEVLREFEPPAQRWLPGHRGVDLAADPGGTVLAAGPGRVAFAGTVAGVGAVSIRHGELRTTYMPVRAEVERGADLESADPIGTVAPGSRHCGTRSCLHWGLLHDGTYLDPLLLLDGDGSGVRLLPLQGAQAPPPHHHHAVQARGWDRL